MTTIEKMKIQFPHLHKHVVLIHNLLDGPKRLKYAMKTMTKKNFNPKTWWERGTGAG